MLAPSSAHRFVPFIIYYGPPLGVARLLPLVSGAGSLPIC